MSKFIEKTDSKVSESEILFPINLENIKLKTDGYKQIESRIKALYPAINDESVKEVTRLYIRLKLKEDPIMVAKAVTKVDSSVFSDYSNRQQKQANVDPSIMVSPQKIDVSKFVAPQILAAQRNGCNSANINISSSAIQPNEITIIPCQISYEDFRKHTNIETCVRLDILQKFPTKFQRYLQQIDKYIKSHYENDFIKKQKWPMKVKFNDPSIRTLDDLNRAKQLQINNSISIKSNCLNNDIPSAGNARVIVDEENITEEKAIKHQEQSSSASNMIDQKTSLKSFGFCVPDINNTEQINDLQSCQNFTFCDVDNFQNSEGSRNMSCDVNDPLFTNSCRSLCENNSTKYDITTFKSPQDNRKPDLKLTHWETDMALLSSNRNNQNDSLFVDEINQKLSESQDSTETDIFPISAKIRNQANVVCLNETLIFEPWNSLQNDSLHASSETSFTAESSTVAINSDLCQTATPVFGRMQTEHNVSQNIPETRSNEGDGPTDGLTGITIKESSVNLSKSHVKNLLKSGVNLISANQNSTKVMLKEFIEADTTNEVCVPETLALQPLQTTQNDVTVTTKNISETAGDVSTEPVEILRSTKERMTKEQLNTVRNVLNQKVANNKVKNPLAISCIETNYTNSNLESPANLTLQLNLKEETSENSEISNNPITRIPNLQIAYSSNDSNLRAKCCQNVSTIKEELDDKFCAAKRKCESASNSTEIEFIEVLPSQPIVIEESDETSENLLAQMMKPSDMPHTPLRISGKCYMPASTENHRSKITQPKQIQESLFLGSKEGEITDNAQFTSSLTNEMPDSLINIRSETVTESDMASKKFKLSNYPEETVMQKSNHESLGQNSITVTPNMQLNLKLRKRCKKFSNENTFSGKKRKTHQIESTGSTNNFIMSVNKSKHTEKYLQNVDSKEKTPTTTKDNCASPFFVKMFKENIASNKKSTSPPVRTTLSKQQHPTTLRKSIINTAIENSPTLDPNSSSNSLHRFSLLYRTLSHGQLWWLTHLNLQPILNTTIDHISYRSIHPISSRHDDPTLKSTIKLWRHKLLIVGVVSNSLNFRLGVNAADEDAMLSFLDISSGRYSSNGVVAIKALQSILAKFTSINISQEIIIINSYYAYTAGEFYIRDEPLDLLQKELVSTSTTILRNSVKNEYQLDMSDQRLEMGSDLSVMTTSKENAESKRNEKATVNSVVSQHFLDSTMSYIERKNENRAVVAPQLESSLSESACVTQNTIEDEILYTGNPHLLNYANLESNIKIEPMDELVSNEELNVIRDLCVRLKTEETDEKEFELDINLIKSQIAQLSELEQICKTEETDSVAGHQTTLTLQQSQLINKVNHNTDIATPIVSEIYSQNESQAPHAKNSIDAGHLAGNNFMYSFKNCQHNYSQTHTLDEQMTINEESGADNMLHLRKEKNSKQRNSTLSNKPKKDSISVPFVIQEQTLKCKETSCNAMKIEKESLPKVGHVVYGKIKNDEIRKPSKRKSTSLVDETIKSNSNNCLGAKNKLTKETIISDHLIRKRKKTQRSNCSETKKQPKCKAKNCTNSKNIDQTIIQQLTHNFRPLNLVCVSKRSKKTAPSKISEEKPRVQQPLRKRKNIEIDLDPDFFIEDTTQIEVKLHNISNSTMSDEERVLMESSDNSDIDFQSVEVSNCVMLIKSFPHQTYCWMTLMNLALLNTNFTHIFYNSSLPLLDSVGETPIQSTVLLRRYDYLECKVFIDNLDFHLKLDATDENSLFALLSALKATNGSEVTSSAFDRIIIRGILQILQKFRKYFLLSIKEEIQYSDCIFSSHFETKSTKSGITIPPNIFFEKILKIFQISRSYD